MSDIAFLPVSELSRQITAGELDSVTLVEAYLQRIERYDDRLHSFIAVYADEARQAAKAADLARLAGHAVGPLHGMPVAIKDIIDIEGQVTTGGSRVWADRISPVTATLVAKMISAGMIVLGKTHTVEFAMGGWGTNEHFGSPCNPWDADTHRAAGGSSAGSGVAVAAGLAPWAIGTDTGGSVRIPSAWCGLTGLKTTTGRISCFGVLPLATTLDTPGPMCRSVDDAATLFQVLQGPDTSDPLTIGLPESDPFVHLQSGVRGLRFGRLPMTELANVDSEVLDAYDASLTQFEKLGATIIEVGLPHSLESIGAMVGRLIGIEGYAVVGELVDQPALPIDTAVRPRIWLGKNLSARDYYLALKQSATVAAEFDHALSDVDALITPTVATAAPAVAAIDQNETPAGFTRLVNLIRRCALTQPNGQTASGLPTAHQIVCGRYDESMALRIGQAFERATDWSLRYPRL